MLSLSFCLLHILYSNVIAHGGHDASGPAKGETIQQYAQRHMSSEHHIDSFDTRSFFQLHDLNRDGVWDREEIEAVYGVHHIYSQKQSKDDLEHQKKADQIVDTVLQNLDKDHDGKVSPEELEAVGLDGLPNFDDLGAEGHHYDVESEFFLHHEEQFHNTPETQTDESYTHPEDREHFSHHEGIEHREAEKEAKFQGITVEEALEQHHLNENAQPPPPPAGEAHPDAHGETHGDVAPDHAPYPVQPHDDAAIGEPTQIVKGKPTRRAPPPESQDPKVKYQGARVEGYQKGEWGSGDEGYKSPTSPGDKMRKNLPYKYKFRRNWGDF